jgi:hypothetical protein
MKGHGGGGGDDVRVAPPRAKSGKGSDSVGATSSAVKALTAKEWVQIEDVSSSVRVVGQVMSIEAERIASQLPPLDPVPLLFSSERFLELKTPPSKPEQKDTTAASNGGKSKNSSSRRGDILRQQELKLLTQDRDRITAASICPSAPRVEGFGERTEAFVVAILKWASGKRACPLDAAVSLSRVEKMLEVRCPNETIEVRRELREAVNAISCRKGGGGLRSFIDLVVEKEEILTSPSFVAPGHLALYPEQREVAGIVAEAVRPSSSLVCLVRYVTPPSGGKSSAAALFGAVVQKARGGGGGGGVLGPVLIYACFSNAVRVEVSKTLIAASVPFGMLTSGVVSLSYRCYDGKPKKKWRASSTGNSVGPQSLTERLRASLSKAVTCDRPPAVFVCDLESALGLVSLPERNDDPLVVDEPTAGVEGSSENKEQKRRCSSDEKVRLCAALLISSPRCTILMSATVPEFEEMPLLVNLFHGKARRLTREWSSGAAGRWVALANGVLRASSSLGAPEWVEDPSHQLRWCCPSVEDASCLQSVSSKRLPVGLRALDATGRQWCPHHFCSNKESLRELIRTLPNDGHLMRFYCVAALAKLVDEISCSGDPVSLGLRVDDLVSHDAVREACLRLLRQNFETLADKCSVSVVVPARDETLSMESVVRSSAHRLQGVTLVVVNEVEMMYEDAMLPLLNDTNVEPIRRILRKMAASSAPPEDQTSKKNKNKHRSRGNNSKRRGGGGDDEDFSNSSDDEESEREDEAAPRRKVPWPSVAVMNSNEHLLRFGPRGIVTKPGRAGKTSPDIPDEVIQASAEALVESILSGVALLNTRWSDQAFEISAIGLADKGSPSLVVADVSMVYGTNLPVDRALVLTSPGKLSAPEIRQFCGRAGRTGKAGRAEVVFGASWQDLVETLSVQLPPEQRRRSNLDREIARAFFRE